MQALALKYRPKNYSELIGQETVSRSLSHALDTKRLSHAYLFSGLRGSGKTSSARIFAKALVCDEGPTSTPCEKCPNCIMANEGRHLDIIEMDAASHRKIDDVRDLIEQTRYAPASARYKVFIIDEVHMLTREAFNAILKTLEEPPEYVKFILATTDPLKLPTTVLSRTQHFRFKPIAKNQIIRHLEKILKNENLNYESGALEILARSGSGSLRDTLTLLDQAIIYSDEFVTQSVVADMLGLLDPVKIDEILSIAIKQDRDGAINIIKELENYDPETIIDEMIANLKERFLRRDAKFSLLMYERFFRILSEAKNMLQISPDNAFTLSVMLFMMMEAVNLKSIDELIETSKSVAKDSEKTDAKISYSDIKESTKINIPENKLTINSQNEEPYSIFLNKIYDRDFDLGECFKRCIKFISFQDNVLILSSSAAGNDKQLLREASKAILDVLRKTFNAKTKIKIDQNTVQNSITEKAEVNDNKLSNSTNVDIGLNSIHNVFDKNLEDSLEKLTKFDKSQTADRKKQKNESLQALNELETFSNDDKKDKNELLIGELDRLFGKGKPVI